MNIEQYRRMLSGINVKESTVEQLIQKAYQSGNKDYRHKKKPVLKIALIVTMVIIAIGSITALGMSLDIKDLFSGFYSIGSDEDVELSERQIEIIEEMDTKVNEKVVQNDTAIKLKSVTRDGNVAIIFIEIIAPVDIVLDNYTMFYETILYEKGNEESIIPITNSPIIDDGNPDDNHCSIALQAELQYNPEATDKDLILKLSDLGRVGDDGYYVMVEGSWKFELKIENNDLTSTYNTTKKAFVYSCVDMDETNTQKHEGVIQEVSLSPISLYFEFIYDDPEIRGSIMEPKIEIGFDDGTITEAALSTGSSMSFNYYESKSEFYVVFSEPIDVEKVTSLKINGCEIIPKKVD